MDSVAYPNVYIGDFLSLIGRPTTKRTEVKWRCPDFVLKMLEEGIHADITLFTDDDNSVKAHRSVLSCVCPDLIEEIEITMCIDALKLFLLLLYTTSEDDDAVVPELSRAINKYFEELYWAISAYDVEKRLGFVLLPALAKHLTPDNCWFFYRDSLHAKHLPHQISSTEICYNYILGNYAEVIRSSSFLEQMKMNNEQMQRIMIHAESQASRRAALRSFRRARINFKRTNNENSEKRS